MIQSFQGKMTKDIFHGIYSHEIRKHMASNTVKAAERRLDLLNCAKDLESFKNIPSMKAEGGVRDAHGKYSIPIDSQWRLTFGWNEGPENVEIKNW